MKLLFVHDGEKLKEDEDGIFYTDGSYNKEVWDRYLTIFGNVTVMFRKDSKIYNPVYAKGNFQFFDKVRINFIEIPNFTSSIWSFLNLRNRLDNKKKIKEVVKQSDYLIARLPSNAGNLAVKYAKKYKKPYLIEVVGCPWDSYWNHSLKGKIIAPGAMLSMRRVVKHAPFVIYVTNKFLQYRYPNNMKNIGCSDVTLKEFNNSLIDERLKKISNFDDQLKKVIGTTAAIDVKYKGQQYIIEALSVLRKQGITNIEYQLVGAGDQSYLKSIAKQYGVEEQVIFLGTLPHEQVFKWLNQLDIYTQPSRQEGLPRALIEAMSRGLPAFGARTGGIPELLEDKYIFSNSKRNIDEICKILQFFNKDNMSNNATRNFNESKKYDKEIIKGIRNKFLNEFIQSGIKNTN
ncbi:glycosyltransferase [Psychrobacillus sp. NPDC096426]|uniref:glycosyltransferase n=1 Tax=Psychrobacillus sp. NPDC096426 TaxID=3364491 RepID=UPI00381A75F8